MKPDIQYCCLKTMEMLVKNLQRCETYQFLKMIKDAVMVKLVIPFGEQADFYVQILNVLIKDKEQELQCQP